MKHFIYYIVLIASITRSIDCLADDGSTNYLELSDGLPFNHKKIPYIGGIKTFCGDYKLMINSEHNRINLDKSKPQKNTVNEEEISAFGRLAGLLEKVKEDDFGKLVQKCESASPSVAVKPLRSANVQGPDIAANGCVVPTGVSFSPPLHAGDSFVMTSVGAPAVTVSVIKGNLREFQYRIRMESSGKIDVICSNCRSVPKNVKVEKNCSPDSSASGSGEARVLVKDGKFLSLLTGSYPRGYFSVIGAELELDIKPTQYTVENPFISIQSDNYISGKYCITVTDSQVRKENCWRD